MHPSRVIRGRTTQLLAGRRIVLGVSGSIAAIEVPRIIRELIRHGAEVSAVMSPEAARLVTPESLEFATGRPPVLQLTGNVEHVSLLGPGEGQADLYLICPATANTIAKVAHGIDDTPVTSCASVALGGGVPMMIAPAMHSHMGVNPAVQEALDKLRGWGVEVITGAQVEGEDKVAGPEEVAAAVLHRLARGPWKGSRVVIVGGAARESIDAVRAVTNESSGRSAVALATQAHYRGAEVELWSGAIQVPIPAWIPTHRWRSVRDLISLAHDRADVLASAAAVFVPAALSDFTLDPAPGKIVSRDLPQLTLTLERAPKVLPELRRGAPPPARLVAFKLDAGTSRRELEAKARALARESGADWVVANDVASMGSGTTEAVLLSPRGGRETLEGTKFEVAGQLLDRIGPELAPKAAPARRDPEARHRRTRSRRARPR
jgi:phosphopantothenoylcysteine decarboxylase / phosphopantothenate---cysteine ligase